MIHTLLTKLRKRAKLSQEEMAEKLGMSRPTVIAIEKGERDISLKELLSISKIFDIPVEVMLDEELSLGEKVVLTGSHERNFQKFYNLILQCLKYGAAEDGKIPKTKLAKLVYLCDFASYYRTLKPISGMSYCKLAQGPVAIEFFDIIDNDPAIKVENKEKAIMLSLLEEPDETLFTKEEKAIIEAVCTKWKNANTQAIVDFTHQQIPWKICKERDMIPYSLINNEAPENVY